MKKREFLAQGGALASGLAAGPWLAGNAQARADAAAQLSQLSAWQARLGEHFEVNSPLGRNMTLHLTAVDVLPQAHASVEQFRLSFEGPRHLPLGEGLHALQGANGTQARLYLQPVRSAGRLRYQAHFSLLA